MVDDGWKMEMEMEWMDGWRQSLSPAKLSRHKNFASPLSRQNNEQYAGISPAKTNMVR